MEKMERKRLRLENFDYGANGYYFITICTKDKKKLFSKRVGNGLDRSGAGMIAEEHLLAIPTHFPQVRIDHYVIMPNHIHAIIVIETANVGRSRPSPTLSMVVGLYKSGVSRAVGYPIWQKSFHDHVIRNETDYQMIWQYIENNPLQWELDELYTEERE